MTLPIGRLQSVWTIEGDLRVYTRISVDPPPPERLPIWMVHGLSVSSRYMMPTSVRLAPHYRVYAPDLPGFGESDDPKQALSVPELADALIRRMEAFDSQRAIMVGNSLGCQIIADVAVRYPERLAAAVLIGPTMDREGRTMVEQARRLFVDATRYESVASVITQSYDYLRCGPRRTLATLRYALEDRIEDKLPHMAVPTLVIRGAQDPIVPQHWAEEVARLLPTSQLLVIPNAPHATNYDDPAPIVEATLSFLGTPDTAMAVIDQRL